jgi:hypothetical protein
VTDDAPASAAKTQRGWLTLYAVAFATMLVAGALLGIAARGFLTNTGLLVLSSGLSALAIVLSIVAIVVPRRR